MVICHLTFDMDHIIRAIYEPYCIWIEYYPYYTWAIYYSLEYKSHIISQSLGKVFNLSHFKLIFTHLVRKLKLWNVI